MPRALIAALLMLLAPFGARAASFQVNPIRVSLSASQATAVLRVTNSSSTPTVIQVQTVAWSQEKNQDVYTPSRALLATPPIFTLAPGSEQVVRVGTRAAPDAKLETPYRLFLTEVPPAPQAGERGVQIALRIGIPVFVEPAVPLAPVLKWTATRLAGNQLQINADNTGNAHVEILKLTLSAPSHSALLVAQFGGYVLPGAHRSWIVKLAAPLAPKAIVGIHADTDRGNLSAQVTMGS